MSKKVLILGNGVAGFTAAATVREEDEECEIILMSQEQERFYNRMLLSKALADEDMLSDIYMENEKWYEERRITNRLGCRIIKINPREHFVEYEDITESTSGNVNGKQRMIPRKREQYDVLIYALGANAFIPDIPGASVRGVMGIRTIADAKKAQESLKESENVVVIGGGILGLEAAWQCKRLGKKVTVIEASKRLMEKQLDEEGSEFLLNLLKDKGIEVHCNKTVMEISADSSQGRVKSVVYADNNMNTTEHEIANIMEQEAKLDTIEADMVIVACGIVPNSKLALESGLGVGTGVMINEYMETTASDIFACGDCVQFKVENENAEAEIYENHGLWGASKQMGEAAGVNAARALKNSKKRGEKAFYTPGRAAFYFKALDTVVFSIGRIAVKSENITDWAIQKGVTHKEIRDVSAGTYEKYYYHGDVMVGAILIGCPDKITSVNERIGILKEDCEMDKGVVSL